MSRRFAVIWHATFCVIAGVLYFFFVLPRWPELLGETPHALGTAMRIVVGALIGLAALPVVFTLLRTRRPELGTPQLALTLRTASIGLHVLAGILIVGAAISEIWLTLDEAGQWLFGIYGAAAALALLGVFTFHLASVAELPPPPPKPVQVRQPKQRRGRGKGVVDEAEEPEEAETSEVSGADAGDSDDASDADAESEPATVTADAEPEPEPQEPGPADDEPQESADGEETAVEPSTANGKLRNRRPSGKDASERRRRRRLRGGVAVDD